MDLDIDEARRTLNDILDEPEQRRGLLPAASFVIDAGDQQGLSTLSVLLELAPEPSLLDGLWALARNSEHREGSRMAALDAIGALLVSARIALEDPDDPDPLTQAQIDQHVKQLTAFYADESHKPGVRRRALEMAANLSSAESIRKAGRAAFDSDDPDWRATGLFVLRISEKDHGRKLVYEALEHDSLAVRCEAIAGLTELGQDEDYERVTDFIYDGSAEERSAALWALVEIPNERAGNILLEASRWLEGRARSEARQANSFWTTQWADTLSSGAEAAPRSVRISSSRRSLDRYLSDDFFDDDGGFGGDGD